MKALTIWQPWASLIMIGAKPYEWRHWPAHRSMIGQRIVIHAGRPKPKQDELWELIQSVIAEANEIEAGEAVTAPTALDVHKALPLLLQLYDGLGGCPLSCGLGTVILGEPKRAGELGFPCDSVRVEEQNWGWPMLDIEPFAEPIPMRGAQGFWPWVEADHAVEGLLL